MQFGGYYRDSITGMQNYVGEKIANGYYMFPLLKLENGVSSWKGFLVLYKSGDTLNSSFVRIISPNSKKKELDAILVTTSEIPIKIIEPELGKAAINPLFTTPNNYNKIVNEYALNTFPPIIAIKPLFMPQSFYRIQF